MKNNNKVLKNRRRLIKWTPPALTVLCVPAHAMTSVVACPGLVVGNFVKSVGSPAAFCGLSFELLSADSAVPLNIISISNTSPIGGDVVGYPNGTTGTVTSVSGIPISWGGASFGAPFVCLDTVSPTNDMTFTVEYDCASDSEVQTVTFLLSEIATIAST